MIEFVQTKSAFLFSLTKKKKTFLSSVQQYQALRLIVLKHKFKCMGVNERLTLQYNLSAYRSIDIKNLGYCK